MLEDHALDANEFPGLNTEGMRGAITSQIEAYRSRIVVVRNSRIYIALLFLISLAAALIGICAVLAAGSQLFPFSALTVGRGMGAAQWGFCGFLIASMCPFMWTMARNMAQCSATLDSSGVHFNLGTKRSPLQVFMQWDKIISLKQQRVGNAQVFTVLAADGNFARYSSYTFLRPKKVTRLIAERTGLSIQKA